MENALTKSGLHVIEGLNSGVLDGYSAGTYTIDPRAEVRSSSEESFLQDAMDSTPLKVYTNTLVHNVLFNQEKVATGVLVETNEGLYTISANKEVVVSSGTVSKLYQLRNSVPNSTLVSFSASAHAFGHWSCLAIRGAWYPGGV